MSMSPFRAAWLKWKSMRLPWRKRFLVGTDLHGNTYWEFRDLRTDEPGRWRRIVKYPMAHHHADVKVSPQWHQWLRHMRKDAPSLEEQRREVARRARMKLLAAQADARWASKPGVMGAPGRPTAAAAALPEGIRGKPDSFVQAPPDAAGFPRNAQGDRQESSTPGESSPESKSPQTADDPWKRARGGPGEDWQPEAWNPSTVKLRK